MRLELQHHLWFKLSLRFYNREMCMQRWHSFLKKSMPAKMHKLWQCCNFPRNLRLYRGIWCGQWILRQTTHLHEIKRGCREWSMCMQIRLPIQQSWILYCKLSSQWGFGFAGLSMCFWVFQKFIWHLCQGLLRKLKPSQWSMQMLVWICKAFQRNMCTIMSC